MYKFLSGILGLLFLVAVGAYSLERCNHSDTRRDLNNKLAKVEKMQQETETAYSKLAIQNEKLQSETKELQQVIDDRNEEILALAQANVRLKDKIFKIKNAKQSVVDKEGNSVEDKEVSCDERIRVDFSQEVDPLSVSGFTLTNPAYAEVKLEWIRDLKLEIILTKDGDVYRIYVDSKNSDIVPTNLQLQVDPSVLQYRWYQKIGFGSDVSISQYGVQVGVAAFYDIFPNFYIGPMLRAEFNGKYFVPYFGIVVGWYPWR